jgi:hypothetical protein
MPIWNRNKILKKMNETANAEFRALAGPRAYKLVLTYRPLSATHKIENLLNFSMHMRIDLVIMSYEWKTSYSNLPIVIKRKVQDALTCAGKEAMEQVVHTCLFQFSITESVSGIEVVALSRHANV